MAAAFNHNSGQVDKDKSVGGGEDVDQNENEDEDETGAEDLPSLRSYGKAGEEEAEAVEEEDAYFRATSFLNSGF
jgi:hypothetical protein